MGTHRGWALALVVAIAGCGGSASDSVQQGTKNGDYGNGDHENGNGNGNGNGAEICCFVTGGGQIEDESGVRYQFNVEAIPVRGPNAGPGFGGVGIAAHGQLRIRQLPQNEPGVEFIGDVDTIVECEEQNGVLIATISGTAGGVRFTAVITDGGEPEEDTIEVSGALELLARGNIQVHQLRNCPEPEPCPKDGKDCECPPNGYPTK